MCSSKPKKQEKEQVNVLTTARDGMKVTTGASNRKQSNVRRDLNNSTLYSGLSIPGG